MTAKKSQPKNRRTWLIIVVVFVALVIGTVAVAFSASKSAPTSKRVANLTNQAVKLFGPGLTKLGIPGKPNITSSCEPDTAGSSAICHSAALYPSNFTIVLSADQLANFTDNASRLDNLFKTQGWIVGTGGQSFSTLTPDTYAASYTIDGQNADYTLGFGKGADAGDYCDITISLTNPSDGTQTAGAVLNVVTFSCSETFS